MHIEHCMNIAKRTLHDMLKIYQSVYVIFLKHEFLNHKTLIEQLRFLCVQIYRTLHTYILTTLVQVAFKFM